LVIVIAVEHFYVDTGLSHASRDLSQLTWNGLVQALNQNFTLLQHTDAGGFESVAGRSSICEKKVRHTPAVYDESAATLDAYIRTAQRVAHFSQRAWSIVQRDRQIFHLCILDIKACRNFARSVCDQQFRVQPLGCRLPAKAPAKLEL
jgi:hypothetical protein